MDLVETQMFMAYMKERYNEGNMKEVVDEAKFERKLDSCVPKIEDNERPMMTAMKEVP